MKEVFSLMRIPRKNKKASHVGFVLSFVIFVTSIIFLYALLVPSLRTDTEKRIISNNLKTELIERLTSELVTASLSVNNSVFSQSCFQFVDFMSKTGISSRIVVQTNSGNILTASLSSNGRDLYIDRTGYTSENFFRVFVSNEFTQVGTYSGLPTPCASFVEEQTNGYSIGLVRTEENIFLSQITKTLNDYVVDYNSLKSELKIPAVNEFGFGFIHENETRISTAEPDLKISVYADRIPVIYIDTEANKKSGDLEVRVW